MNEAWAIAELKDFISKCQLHSAAYRAAGDLAYQNPQISAMHADARSRLLIVKKIADLAWPDWRDHVRKSGTLSWEYDPMVPIAEQLIVLLERSEELKENLGEVGPALSASIMHRDVWEAASSLWRNGHFGEAVSAAARSVNAALQTKVGRRDAAEGKLLTESFSLDPPKPNVPRLRLMLDDGSDTYKSLHIGVSNFGQGCFKAIRNVLAHEYGQIAEPPEEEALHYLAAFSIVARWIEQATVEK